jgi:hypothetical protein
MPLFRINVNLKLFSARPCVLAMLARRLAGGRMKIRTEKFENGRSPGCDERREVMPATDIGNLGTGVPAGMTVDTAEL